MGYYRPQTKFAKVMFLHLSVCSQGDLHPGEGFASGGGGGQIPHCILWDAVNERAVRILLECIRINNKKVTIYCYERQKVTLGL